jgi:hypothetical protein
MTSDELIRELKQARYRLHEAELAQSEAKEAYITRKAETMRCLAVVEEILREVETGASGRPLLDAIAAKTARPPAAPVSASAPQRTQEASPPSGNGPRRRGPRRKRSWG